MRGTDEPPLSRGPADPPTAAGLAAAIARALGSAAHHQALRGARDTIGSGRGRLRLIVEMHPTLWAASGTSRAELESLLAELELRPDPLTGQRDALGEYGIVTLEPVVGGS
jgi:hypothetical protein